MRDFHKLLAWQKADDLAVAIYRATEKFPAVERFGLTSQLRRAAISAPANIAEGCGRESLADFRHFLYQARGSLNEVEYYLHLAGRLGYLSPPLQTDLLNACQETGKILQGLINSIDQQMSAGRKTN